MNILNHCMCLCANKWQKQLVKIATESLTLPTCKHPHFILAAEDVRVPNCKNK